jgi:hypothetical protein
MKLYELRPDIVLNLDQICLVVDRGYYGTKRRIRIYTPDGRHEYDLSVEEWTKFQLMLKENETV